MTADSPRPLVLEIARIGLEIRTFDPEIQMVAGPDHAPFLTEGAGGDCARIVLLPSAYRVARRRPAKLAFDSGCIWHVEETGDTRLLTMRSPIYGSEPYLVVEFDRDFGRGRGETLVGGPHLLGGKMQPFAYPFDEVVFLARLSRGRGVLVHACGVSYRGRGLLFLGTSGAGKSTMARLWKGRQGATILSDDRVVIRADGDGYRIFGTPWHTDTACQVPASAPLDAVFILEQAPRNQIEQLPPSTAVAQMMVRAFPAMWDQEGLEYAVRFLATLADRVQVRRLHFLLDETAVDYVLSALRSQSTRDQDDSIGE